jgi:acyl carrier protein
MPMSESLETSLKELIVERLFLDIDPSEIETDTELSEYGVDSFLLLELIVAMEEMFEVKFEQSDIKAEVLKSVKSLADLIRSKQ